jgi:tetratricopeptide (TPR) repeat protein
MERPMVRAQLRRSAELLERGGADEAEALAREVLERDARCAEAHELVGIALVKRGRPEEARAHLERACDLEPDSARFHHNLGGALRELGRFPDAEARFRAALEREPGYVEAIQGLVEVRRFRDPADPILLQIEKLLAQGPPSPRARSFLHFAAGKALDDLSQPDRAFPHFAAGNLAAGRRFDAQAHCRRLGEIVFANGRDRLRARHERRPQPAGSPWRMLFLVGMPRSGTSLLEQMLSRHPRVHWAGELPDVQAIAQQIARVAGVDGRRIGCPTGRVGSSTRIRPTRSTWG